MEFRSTKHGLFGRLSAILTAPEGDLSLIRRISNTFVVSATLLVAASTSLSALPLQAPVAYRVDSAPVGIGAADSPDARGPGFVTLNATGSQLPSLSLLNNQGGGRFFFEERVSISSSALILHSMAIADFDADGDLDTAVALDDLEDPSNPTAQIRIYDTSPEGDATPIEQIAIDGIFPTCLEAIDVNADGVLDLVVCHAELGASIGVVTVLTGSASGFTPGRPTAAGILPIAVAGADIDGNGGEEIIVADSNGDAILALLPGQAPRLLAKLDTPSDLAVADFDGDGDDDIAASSALSGIVVLEQVTPGVFRRHELPSSGGLTVLAAADLDGDGNHDIIAAANDPQALLYWAGDGAGGFQASPPLALHRTLSDIALADIDGDGRLDLAASSEISNEVLVFRAAVEEAAATHCPPVPLDDCVVAEQTNLLLQSGARAGAERILWQWRTRSAGAEPFGNPVGEPALFSLCLYEEEAEGSVLEATTRDYNCSGSSCWQIKGGQRLRYRDRARYPGGILDIKMSDNQRGRALLTLRGRGGDLTLPELPIGGSVVVQLVSSSGLCWTSGVIDEALRNDDRQFKARVR